MKILNATKENPKLFCLNYRECDPKKCTGFKLSRLNLIKIVKKIDKNLKDSVILNPFAPKILSNHDRNIVLRYGLIVIDCSWSNIMNLKNLKFKNMRKLPSFIAANPTNYGKWEKLSSAEALAAALYITYFFDLGDLILSKFSWGNEFKEINKFLKKKKIKKL
jgi:pre-rRNA-processing protein TSR3